MRWLYGLSIVLFSSCHLTGCGGGIEAGMPTDVKTPTAMPDVKHVDMKDIMKQGKASRMPTGTGGKARKR